MLLDSCFSFQLGLNFVFFLLTPGAYLTQVARLMSFDFILLYYEQGTMSLSFK